MTIVRAPRPDNGFLLARNDVLRDERLSYRALGLLLHMLSHADGWQFSADTLARKAYGSGRDAVQGSMRELREAGYVRTVKHRNELGRFNTVNYVFDTPDTELPARESPAPVTPAPLEDHSKKDHSALRAVASPPETEGQRINRLTTIYTDLVPLSAFGAVQGVVRKAVKSGLYDDATITRGLTGLADEGRPVTMDTLRIQMEGMGPLPKRPTKTDRFAELSKKYADGPPELPRRS